MNRWVTRGSIARAFVAAFGTLLVAGVAIAETARLDYSAGFAGRNRPRSAWGWAEAGYGQTFWGEPTPGNFLYGFVRPWVNLGSIAVVHEAAAGVDFYPVSFAGIRLAKHRMLRNTESIYFDCTEYSCRGYLDRAELTTDVTLGAAGWFANGMYRRDILLPGSKDRPFVDDNTTLSGKAGGDIVTNARLVAGRQLPDDVVVGVMTMADSMRGTGDHSNATYLMGSLKRGEYNWMAAVGQYRSSVLAPGLSVIATFSWTPTETFGVR